MDKTCRIRPALSTEAACISALAIRSKASWGYPEEQMAVFRRELILLEEHIVPKRTHVLEADGAIVGFYTLVPHDATTLELAHLFIEPTKLRQGYGSQLFRHARQSAQEANFRVLVIQSDPHAVGFYRALGAQLTHEIPSVYPVAPFLTLSSISRSQSLPNQPAPGDAALVAV